jgi:hypothetical protein
VDLFDGAALINAVDAEGNTPLHAAVALDGKNTNPDWRRAWHVRELLKAGADSSVSNKAGMTPIGLLGAETDQMPKTLVALSPAPAPTPAPAPIPAPVPTLAEKQLMPVVTMLETRGGAGGDGVAGYTELNAAVVEGVEGAVSADAVVDLSSMLREYIGRQREIE